MGIEKCQNWFKLILQLIDFFFWAFPSAPFSRYRSGVPHFRVRALHSWKFLASLKTFTNAFGGAPYPNARKLASRLKLQLFYNLLTLVFCLKSLDNSINLKKQRRLFYDFTTSFFIFSNFIKCNLLLHSFRWWFWNNINSKGFNFSFFI